MSIKTNEPLEIKQKHNFYQFFFSKGRKLIIDSSFDNGNIVLNKQINELHVNSQVIQYRLSAVSDYENILNKKTWFYFRLRAPENIRIRIVIDNVNMFENMYQDKNWNRPVCREGEDGPWQPIKEAFLTMHQEIEIIIDYTFTQNKDAYFALAIPFTYFQHQQYLNQLPFHSPQNVTLKQQIIGYSPKGRPIHVISLTEKIQQTSNKQKIIQAVSELPRKPIVLITARVHAGQVSSSYCLMGMIQFLLRPYNIQSCILRKMFEFIIFPLVNPDGVYEGNYRMDTNGENLNRVYGQPDSQKHSSIYHIKNYVGQLAKQTAIIYQFDLHSHSSSKQAFIYGNAFDDIVSQTESQIFCKLLQQNSSFFKYSISHFGQKHMKAKDKGQALSKQGCARVVFSKMANITNSYTVQTSIFKYSNDYISNDSLTIEAMSPSNTNFEIGEMYYEKMLLKQQPQNIIGQNKQLGYSIMISILDHLNKNPCSTIPSELKDQFRKDIAYNLLQNEDRFKLLDMKAYHKSKNILRFVKEQFTEKYDKLWSWLGYDKQMATANWPGDFKWFSTNPQFKLEKKKFLKMRTQASEKQLRSAKIEFSECKIKKRPLMEKQYSIVPPQNLNLDAIPIIRRSIEAKPPIYKQAYERAKTMENIEDGKINTQMLKINKFRENETVTMKNNLLLTFIEEQITRLNDKRAKKNITAFNRLISYKAALKEKSKLQKTRFNNQKIVINSSKKLVSIYDKLQLVRQKSQEKIVERESDQNLEENDIFNQLMQENIEQQDQLNELRRKRQTINCKREIAKAKFNEIKKKTISITDKKLKDTNQNFTTGIKLPQLSNIRLYMGQKINQNRTQKANIIGS